MPGKESLAPQDWFRKADADYPFMVEPPPEEEVRNFLEQTKQLIEFIFAELSSSQQRLHKPDEGGKS
jgi:hypothetical protein